MSAENLILSHNERKEIEKFYKYFTFKAVQVIVQSRLGEKIKTYSKPFSGGQEWFNLAIFDLPDVMNEVKRVLAHCTHSSGDYNSSQGTQDEFIQEEEELLVEISLKTVDEETMILEVWHLSPLSPFAQARSSQQTGDNATQKVGVTSASYTSASGAGPSCSPSAFGIYTNMGSALKRLLTVSRTLPAYRLARQQSAPDSTFVVCYRLRASRPVLPLAGGTSPTLGHAPRTLKIAAPSPSSSSPTGPRDNDPPGFTVWVEYRTDMTFSSTSSERQAVVTRSPERKTADDGRTADRSPTVAAIPRVPDCLDRSVIDSMFDPETYKAPAFVPPDLHATTFKAHYDPSPAHFNMDALVKAKLTTVLTRPSKTAEKRETSKSSENVSKNAETRRQKRCPSSSDTENPTSPQGTKNLDLEFSEPLKAPFANLDPGLDAIAFYRLVQKVPDLAWFSDSNRPQETLNADALNTLASLRSQFALLEERASEFEAFATSLDLNERKKDASASALINA